MKSGEKIKIFAKSVGGLTKLAEIMEMSASNLSQYANDRAEPGMTILQRLFNAGCDMNWFFSNIDSSVKVYEPLEKYVSLDLNKEIEIIKHRLEVLESKIK